MTTVTVKTSELVGAALDWAVADATGEPLSAVTVGYVTGSGKPCGKFSPSTDWGQVGLIIERSKLMICHESHGDWSATYFNDDDQLDFEIGETPLIAACRAIVAEKLGDTVEVPEELL